MIPRRRIDISCNDIREWFRALFRNGNVDDVANFESDFARYLGIKHARATASGRDAITVALDAMGVKTGDEILVPAYTLGELMPVLKGAGYHPIPVDVDLDTFNIDPDCIAERISDKTKAIIATHILGSPCDMKRIIELARKHSLLVLEDCAHALGATIGGTIIGTLGDAAIFSLEPNKALPTYGGGMLVTNDEKISARVDQAVAERKVCRCPAMKRAVTTWIEELVIRSAFYGIIHALLFSERMADAVERSYRSSHGRRREPVSYSPFQARLGLSRLAVVESRNEKCNEMWDEMANALPSEFKTQDRRRFGTPAFYNLVVRSTRSTTLDLRKRLRMKGIDIGIGTEVMDNCGPALGFDDCSNAQELVDSGLLVPLYPGLTERRMKRIINAFRAISSEVIDNDH